MASSDATRIDKIGYFFSVAELKDLQVCPARYRHQGAFLLSSDLKLKDWLQATMISTINLDTPGPLDATGPYKSNVISHDVKFEILSNSSVTPTWHMTSNAQLNPSNTPTFLSLTRDRIQELVITLGPPDPAWVVAVVDPKTGKRVLRPTQLGPAAASSAFATDIKSSLTGSNLSN